MSGNLPKSRVGIVRNVFIFCTSLVSFMALFSPTPPAPRRLEEKLAISATRQDIDLVFAGSSRTHFQFDPSAFNAEAERYGIPVEGFNMGLAGAEGHEIDYILEKFVLPIPSLKYVFVEIPKFEYQTLDVHERTFRKIYWHDMRRTVDSVRTSLREPSQFGVRWIEARKHLLHFCLRFCGRWVVGHEQVAAPNTDGYMEWERQENEDESVELNRAARGRTYSKRYDLLEEVVRRQVERFRSRGVKIYYVFPPGTPVYPILLEMERRGEIPGVFALNDPQVYPELFVSVAKGGYLTRSEARLYSEALARKFTESLLSGGLTLATTPRSP